MYNDTPECDKLHEIQPKSQAIGEFLDWLASRGMRIMRWVEIAPRDQHYQPITSSVTDLLAEYFEIDMNAVENERRCALDGLRRQHEDEKQKGKPNGRRRKRDNVEA